MGLFDGPLAKVDAWLEAAQRAGRVRQLDLAAHAGWPRESSLVLAEDAAVELGRPELGSLGFVLWREGPPGGQDRALLIGPDLDAIAGAAPLARIVIARGHFPDPYENWRALRDAVFDTRLAGLMSRNIPSQLTVWSRVSRDALGRGFRLGHWAAALAESVSNLDFVSTTTVVLATEPGLSPLADAGREAARIAGALLRLREEPEHDCESCEFSDACAAVEELKALRQQMLEQRRR
jgi:hypothetical protein